MKKNIKNLISLYLCLLTICGVLSDTVNAKTKEPIQLGDYIYASVYNKTLNVTGEGEMYNNSHNDGYFTDGVNKIYLNCVF